MLTTDAVVDFSGGMNNRLTSDRIGDAQAAHIENMEFRDNRLKTRRGSYVLSNSVDGELFQGAGVFRAPLGSEFDETMLVAQGNKVYAFTQSLIRTPMTLPGTLSSTDDVFFLQGIGYIYIFSGETKGVWRWNGKFSSAIELVTANMPGANRGAFAYNRFWIPTNVDDLNISDALSENFNFATHTIKVTQGDGQRIIQVVPFAEGAIIVFKERSVALISGANGVITDASADLTIQFIDNNFGCVARDSVQIIGTDVYFLSRKGVMTLALNEQQKVQSVQVPLSETISNSLELINWSKIDTAQSLHFDNYYLLAVPCDGASLPNCIFAYDLLHGSWSGVFRFRDVLGNLLTPTGDPAFAIRSLFNFSHNGYDIPVAIGNEGMLVQLFANNYQDFSSSNEFYLSFDATSLKLTSSGTLPTALTNQTAGIVRIKFRTTSTALQYLGEFDSSDNIRWYISNADQRFYAEAVISSVVQWRFYIDDALSTDTWYEVVVTQDGTAPTAYINGTNAAITFTVSVDKTVWINDMVSSGMDLYVGSVSSSSNNIIGDIAHFYVYDYDGTLSGSGPASPQISLPLNEGFGGSVTDKTSSITFNLTGAPSWYPQSNNLSFASYLEYEAADYATSTNIITQTALEDQTAGIIEFRWRASAIASNTKVVNIKNSATSERLEIVITGTLVPQVAYYNSSGVIQILGSFLGGNLDAQNWYTVRLTQDGTGHTLTVTGEGSEHLDPETYYITGTDAEKVKWLSDYTVDTVVIGPDGAGSTIEIEYVHFMNIDGSTMAYIPQNNDTTLTEVNNANVTFAVTGSPQVNSTRQVNHICTELKTRSLFRGSLSKKKIMDGEIAIRYKDPKFTLKSKTPHGVERSLITAKDYATNSYHTAKTDWVNSNTNLDHDDPHRQNYSPLQVPTTGVTINAGGIQLNREAEFREKFYVNDTEQRIDFSLTNTQGEISLVSLGVNADDEGFIS